MTEIDRIKRLLACESIQDYEREAFDSMLYRLTSKRFRTLTEKQLAWLVALEERYEINIGDAPGVLYDSGKIPRGKDVKTPDVLMNLPKKPPKRDG